jgi:hypothetical protein
MYCKNVNGKLQHERREIDVIIMQDNKLLHFF